MYYLMYPDKADPTLMTTTNSLSFYDPGTNFPSMNVSGATISSVAVSLPTKGTFDVDVTATSSVSGASITRGTCTVVAAGAICAEVFAGLPGNVRVAAGAGRLDDLWLDPLRWWLCQQQRHLRCRDRAAFRHEHKPHALLSQRSVPNL